MLGACGVEWLAQQAPGEVEEKSPEVELSEILESNQQKERNTVKAICCLQVEKYHCSNSVHRETEMTVRAAQKVKACCQSLGVPRNDHG